MEDSKKRVAKILLDAGCLKINRKEPFTYASGLKGPLYCDNRLLLSQTMARKEICQSFLNLFSPLQHKCDVIAAMATGAIAYGAFLAQQLDKPLVYIRSKAKGHGQNNLIEGGNIEGQRIVLIEDLINQGSSIAIGLDEINRAKGHALACFCIVDYQMQKAKEVLEQRNCLVQSLTNFESILEFAKESGRIQEDDYQMIVRWHQDPDHWP